MVTNGHEYAGTGPPKACLGVLLRAQAGEGGTEPPTRAGRGLRSRRCLDPVWASVVPLIRRAHGYLGTGPGLP